MFEELSSAKIVVGVRQLSRAIRSGRVRRAYLALDADPMLVDPLRLLCKAQGVETVDAPSMAQLGKACGISVKAAACGVLS